MILSAAKISQRFFMVALPSIAGILAVIQDIHFTRPCMKNLIFVVILFQVASHVWLGSRFIGWIWFAVAGAASTLLITNEFLSPILPDSYILTQRELFQGFPIIEGGLALIFLAIVGVGISKRKISRNDAIAYIIGLFCILASARLFTAHVDYVHERPDVSWRSEQAYLTIELVNTRGVFVGKSWVISNTDYNKVASSLMKIQDSGIRENFWWGSLKQEEGLFLFKVRESEGVAFLDYQWKDFDTNIKDNWSWMAVISFALVFLETLLITRIMLADLVEKARDIAF